MTVYINGIKATKADITYLQQQINSGKDQITSIKRTKLGSISIKTN